MNLSELQAKIEKFSKLLNDFGATGAGSKELWQLQKEIVRDFKETIFENKEENQQHWEGFQLLVDKLRTKQDQLNAEYEKFAEEADAIIGQLEASITNGFFSGQLEKTDFTTKKEDFAKAFELFKENRWPSRERRTVAWDKYNGLRDMLKKEEDEFYIRLREKITQRSQNSQQLTEKIIVVIDHCHPDVTVDALADILKKWVQYLTGINSSTDAFAWVPAMKEEQLKTPLKLRSDALSGIRKFINDNRDSLTKEDKQKIYERIDLVNEDLDKAWTAYKEELQQKREAWEERKKQNEEKQIAWEKKQRDFLAMLEDRLEKQLAFKTKLEKVYDNQLGFLEKQEARYTSQQDYLNKLHDQMEDLEDKLATAWTDDFKNKVTGWIDEKNAKISEVENSLPDIEEKITDVKKNIDELPDKIKDVEKSIGEIKDKIAEVKAKLDK
ncbi:MAG: hypothetical protein QM737_23650 [Ferruginibacter sp.]